jgi:glucose/arabinose dehydrogenase
MQHPSRLAPALRAVFVVFASLAAASPAAQAGMTLRLQDYATAPQTGNGTFENGVYFARVNFLADDPINANRMFVNDLNGPLYMMDKTTKTFTEYLNFNGRGSAPGLFDRMYREGGYATGLVTFQFDPDYANNGKFYTIHVEEGDDGVTTPSNANYPGLNTAGYAETTSFNNPAAGSWRNVLVEWTDTNPANATFEGSVRELLRVGQRSRIHPMGDIIFNPAATPSDPDWRVMYVSIGDGSNGENGPNSTRRTPQRLDSFGGKIIRIRPDNVGANTSLTLEPDNGEYYIPTDNPYRSINDSAVRDEIYAAGFRNPHRMSWDVDPHNPANNRLIVNDIGLNTWEEVNIVHAGGNYGYSEREGNQVLSGLATLPGPLPSPDQVTLRITSTTTVGPVTPKYPVIQYGHGLEGQTGPKGDSVSSGYVYRGSNIPSLYGKYVFGDITTGQLFWSDYAEMLAVDDGNAATLATIHSFDVLWDDPNVGGGEALFTTQTPDGAVLGPMHQIIEDGYEARGGTDSNLPGGANVTGPYGRADIRIQVDAAGELYIISKSDGMIRYIVEAAGNADFNDDDQVDGRDFLIWQRNLGSAGGLAEGDADGDGRVTSADLGYIRQQFGPTTPVAAVPEPAAAWLALIGLAALRRRR